MACLPRNTRSLFRPPSGLPERDACPAGTGGFPIRSSSKAGSVGGVLASLLVQAAFLLFLLAAFHVSFPPVPGDRDTSKTFTLAVPSTPKPPAARPAKAARTMPLRRQVHHFTPAMAMASPVVAGEWLTVPSAPAQVPAPSAVAQPAPETIVVPDADLFRKRLEARIAHFLRYPQAALASRIEGTAVVGFHLLRQGKVEEVRLLDSSGSPILDKEALATVRRAAPMPSAPAAFPDALDVSVPVRFALRGPAVQIAGLAPR
jgi:periplasmic protein TonB